MANLGNIGIVFDPFNPATGYTGSHYAGLLRPRPGVISGSVEIREGAGKTRVALVMARNHGAVQETLCESDGSFIFRDVPSGRYEVIVSGEADYEPLVRSKVFGPFVVP